jgi:hypothetical protein
MHAIRTRPVQALLAILLLMQLACGVAATTPEPTATTAPTNTLTPTATITLTPTNTPRPSPTPRPTKTPNLAATERMEGFNAETQGYFEKGYLTTTSGKITEVDDFREDWAQLGWYNWWRLNTKTSDFYISAHLKWSSAYRSADESGCGFLFAVQENGDHYAVFLDRSSIVFLNADQTSGYSRAVGVTRGTGRVKFDNPADKPVEADLTVIVKGAYAYVLVDGEVVGEYTLAQSKNLNGNLGLSLLSGTNKDFGTRCEMTDIHIWTPE